MRVSVRNLLIRLLVYSSLISIGGFVIWLASAPDDDLTTFDSRAAYKQSEHRAPSYAGESKSADQADFMDDTEIVLGLVVNGEAKAYPVRYVARMAEHVNDRMGGVPICATW